MASSGSKAGIGRPMSAVPVEGLVYTCGDIHGRDDLLEDFLAWVARDRGAQPATIVFLGDYTDRGPGGRKVVERLMKGPDSSDETWVKLKGNHDALFAAAYRDTSSEEARAWTRHGGLETLASYGGGADGLPIHRAVPESHIRFLESLPLAADDGERLYVHAGVRPGVAFEDQTEHDLMWIREEFLDRHHGFDRVVVHGHTISRNGPEVHPHRINMDTGAYATGSLACARFEPGNPVPTFYRTGQVHTYEAKPWAPAGEDGGIPWREGMRDRRTCPSSDVREVPIVDAKPWRPGPSDQVGSYRP